MVDLPKNQEMSRDSLQQIYIFTIFIENFVNNQLGLGRLAIAHEVIIPTD